LIYLHQLDVFSHLWIIVLSNEK